MTSVPGHAPIFYPFYLYLCFAIRPFFEQFGQGVLCKNKRELYAQKRSFSRRYPIDAAVFRVLRGSSIPAAVFAIWRAGCYMDGCVLHSTFRRKNAVGSSTGSMLDTLTLADVARIMHVSRMTIRNWVRAGKFIAPLPFSSRCRWSAEAFHRWLEQQQGGAHAANAG
jgi:excisionase family DNA binding protein